MNDYILEIVMELLIGKKIRIFDRSPIIYASLYFISNIVKLFPFLPYECCEVIANNIPMSPTIFALCQQLDVFDLSPNVTKSRMHYISRMSKTNFLLMSKFDFAYARTNEIQIHAIDYKYDTTMVIYTTEHELDDDSLQLEYLNDYKLVEQTDMFKEYVLSYTTINKFELKHVNYNKILLIDEFNSYSGMQYDRILWTVVPVFEQRCIPIYDNKNIPLNKFALELMKSIHGTDALAIMIIKKWYYVFGMFGSTQCSVFEIHDDGTFSFPDTFLLSHYRLGNVEELMSCTKKLK